MSDLENTPSTENSVEIRRAGDAALVYHNGLAITGVRGGDPEMSDIILTALRNLGYAGAAREFQRVLADIEARPGAAPLAVGQERAGLDLRKRKAS
jgi:hypothetical protein